MRHRRQLAGLLLAILAIPAARADVSLDVVRPFLKQYCHDCHGPEKQKNDLRFDTLATNLSDRQTLSVWQDILDQLNRGEMPPKKAAVHPSPGETAEAIDTLSAVLKAAYARERSTNQEAVLRRLNRLELRYTLRDLLYLEGGEFRSGTVADLYDNNGNGRVDRPGSDPISDFPADEEEEGFDNIGDRLVMSDFLLKLLIKAAEESLALATHPTAMPKVATRRFAGPIRAKLPGNNLEFWSRQVNPEYDAIFQRYTHRGEAQVMPDALGKGVGTAARYRITIEASAHNQVHPWGELIKSRQDEPMLLGLHVVDLRQGGLNPNNPSTRLVAQWPLPGDGSVQTFTCETWLDPTWTPWVGWENAPYERSLRPWQLVEKYLPGAFRPRPGKKAPKEVKAAYEPEMAHALLKAGYRGPHLRIQSMTLEPLIDTWPPRSHTALYGTGPLDDGMIESLLTSFATRAFRRPVAPAEVAPYLALVRRHLEEEDAEPVIADLRYTLYEGEWSRLPEFATLTPVAEGSLADGLLDLRVAKRDAHYGIVFTGKLKTTRPGKYQFEIASDDGSRVVINGQRVIDHDGLHGASTRKGAVELTAGEHDLRIEYFAFGSPNSLRASWSGPGFTGAPLSVAATAPKPIHADATSARRMKALQAGYTAILCSPRFLYIAEKANRLDHYEIASRLSYFLWSSMPDDELFALAAAGKLHDPAVLRRQVKRMLQHENARAFTRRFPERWLRLDKLGAMPPERGGPFRIYWDRKLEPQMVKQTEAFFADLLENNGPIRNFIDSDYTFLNERLAALLYGRDDIWGDGFRKVKVNDPRRGGILTQPSVMTATANGVDTSPVVRGVWVLENILGNPPSPPPPDVEPLSPDLRGAITIREQLERHREVASCNNCHRKIDPMGFAFENYDPIGRWRETYPNTKPRRDIDPSATLSNGTKLDDIVALKKSLLTRTDDIARCLTEKLLTYASGRTLEPADRGEVDRIVEELKTRGDGLQDLVMLVVESGIFLTK